MRLVTQLLIAHEACGAVHAAAVVGGSFARFYVLGAGLIATDLGGATGQTLGRPMLDRPTTTLDDLVRHPILQVSLGEEQPGLACAWDLCTSPELGPPPQLDVSFGQGLNVLASMLTAACERVAASDGMPARPHTVLQDVLGAVKEQRMQPVPAEAPPSTDDYVTAGILRYIDNTVRMVPMTPNEMTKLIDSARWVPKAMYTALNSLTSGFEAQPQSATATESPRLDRWSAARDEEVHGFAEDGEVIEAEHSEFAAATATAPSEELVGGGAVDPDAWWGEKLGGAQAGSAQLAGTGGGIREEIEEEDPELDGFKLGMAAGTENELFDTYGEFFVSIDGVEDPVFDPIHSAAEATAPEAGVTKADAPQPGKGTIFDAALAASTASTASMAETLVPPAAPETEEALPTDPTPVRKPAPSLPPHLASLQALYDLEGDVVKTTEVTTKVDVPGMRAPPERPMGFRGSSGAGPRRPGEEPADGGEQAQ